VSQEFNIGFVISAFDGGGGPQATQDIMNALKNHNLESSLYSFMTTNKDVKKSILSRLSDCSKLFKYLWKLNKTKRTSVIFNSAGLEVGFVLAIFVQIINILSSRKLLLVNIYHNALINPESTVFNNKIRLGVSNFIITTSKRFVCVSAGVLSEITQLSSTDKRVKEINEKGCVIYNAVKKFDTIHSKPIIYPFDGKVVLAIGRLCLQKSFHILLEAHALLKPSELNKVHLVIVGDGELKVSLQTLSKELGTSEYVHFWGYEVDVLPHYLAANAFVLSSQHEGFGLVLAEALSCGLPVVSTDCPYGPSEILNDGEFGELVPVGNIFLLSQAIDKILSSSAIELQEVKIRNMNRALDFNVIALGKHYSDLIRQIL